MNNIERKAQELLADGYAAIGWPHLGEDVRSGAASIEPHILHAITAALTPPEGYVLVPVEPTEAMIEAICTEHGSGGWPQGYGRYAQHIRREHAGEGYRAMLAARPEVKNER